MVGMFLLSALVITVSVRSLFYSRGCGVVLEDGTLVK